MDKSNRKFSLWKVLLVLLAITVSSFIILYLWFAPNSNKHVRNATQKEAIYLHDLLKGTNKIKIIISCYENKSPGIAEITDPKVISEFVEACIFTKVDKYCLCLSNVNIECYLNSGEIIKLNYYGAIFESYVKFPNPWGIQGKPGTAFRRLISKFEDNIQVDRRPESMMKDQDHFPK